MNKKSIFYCINALDKKKNKRRRFFYTSETRDSGVINFIPKSYKKESKTSKIWIDFAIFNGRDFKRFGHEIFYSNKLIPGLDYSLLIKIKKNDIYFTIAEKQKKFNFNSLNDYSFEKIFDYIWDKLNDIFEEYKAELEYSCDSILLEFRQVTIGEKLKISNLDTIKQGGHTKMDFAFISKDLNYFGYTLKDIKGSPLNFSIIEGGLHIYNSYNIENLDRFLDEYNRKMTIDIIPDYLVKDSTKFYLRYNMNRPYIISVNTSEESNIIEKRCFNIHGDLISKIKDILNNDGTFTRESRNSTTVYKGNTIISMGRNIKFKPINKNQYAYTNINKQKKDWLPNINIGTLDLETYENDGVAKCYAIGFYCRELDKTPKTFYIDKDLDSDRLIHECISEMVKAKYNKYIFYVHNLGKFDAAFIIKALLNFNSTLEGKNNPYIIDISTRNSDILSLTVKRRVNDRIHSVKLKDSVAVLPRELRKLCKDYEVTIEKGYFPYNFCTKDTLFYIGHTPSIDYYVNISTQDYDSLYKEVWSLKEECILYLKKDLISLYEVLFKVNKTIHLLFKLQMTDNLTISGISLKYFLKDHYYPDVKPIPLVTNRIVWNDIYKAYTGGRVEVYNAYFKKTKNSNNLYYYDVNSLYPYASLNRMPGLNCQYLESFGEPLKLEELFGFFYCKINSNGNDYLGLLPKRTDNGNLIFPIGEWYGWYFTEELLSAKKGGYIIDPLKGYNFDVVNGVFTSFVTRVMDIKINSKNPSEKNVAKLILNSLIGRFGMDFLKKITKLVDGNTHDLISVTRALSSSIDIGDNLFLDTFKPGIDKEVCKEFGVDLIKALNTESVDEKSTIRTFQSVSLPIAAATLSYARIHMAKLMKYILDNGGNIYYTDTDSLVTDLKLPEDFVHPSKLGKLKLEHVIEEAYFITDKTYAFINNEGELVKKAKGIDSNYLSFEDYKKMYQMESIQSAVKKTSIRDYSKGSVIITTKDNIKLNIDQYTKRERIFKGKTWIGTKPIIIKEE